MKKFRTHNIAYPFMSNSLPTYQPFQLDREQDYQRWRSAKLDNYSAMAADAVVPVQNAAALSLAEHAAIMERCCKLNLAIYTVTGEADTDKSAVRALGQAVWSGNAGYEPACGRRQYYLTAGG